MVFKGVLQEKDDPEMQGQSEWASSQQQGETLHPSGQERGQVWFVGGNHFGAVGGKEVETGRGDQGGGGSSRAVRSPELGSGREAEDAPRTRRQESVSGVRVRAK
jgi:hypothetical protein